MNNTNAILSGLTQSLEGLHGLLFDVERIPFAIFAILLTLIVGMVTGPMHGNANPFLWLVIDKVFGGFGDKLDKPARPAADLLFRGFIVFAVVVLVMAALAEAAKYIVTHFNVLGVMQALLVSLALTSGSVWFALLRFYFTLDKKDIKKGTYYAIARTARVDLNATDEYGMTRLGMGLSVRALDKGLVAPVLWYLIGGLTALYVYAGIAALAWRFGQNGFTKGFGGVALGMEKLLGLIPSIFTAFLVTAASVLTPTAGIFRSIRSWMGSKGAASYAQGGLPLTALAWTLKVSLGGSVKDLQGRAQKQKWVGPEEATAKVEPYHMKRAFYITAMAQLVFVAALLVAYVWGGFIGG